MKIDSYIPSGANDPVRRAGEAAPAAQGRPMNRVTADPADSVEVSELAAASLAREQKLAQLEAQVAAAGYRPDARAIARALTADLLGE